LREFFWLWAGALFHKLHAVEPNINMPGARPMIVKPFATVMI
jgi:hypothetical protein